ncbi:MAG: AIR synthase related protein [Oscillibacter sp.]
MCVNDIICRGAKPLFFLTTSPSARTSWKRSCRWSRRIRGLCAGCALIGGETVEHPAR